jgi:hypothetical protein
VTGRVESPPALSGLPDAGRALASRFGDGWTDMPVTESAGDWAESLTAHLPAEAAFAVLEHLFGVLPLLDAFFEPRGTIAEAVSGAKLGALGLFTPSPELGWAAAAVAGEPSGKGLLLRGAIRLPGPASDGSIVLARLEDGPEHRLAWLDHGARGVERRRSGMEQPAGESPRWLDLEDVLVGPDLVSRPVTLAPGSQLCRRLEAYAGVWALAAVICARDGVRSLRRAARTAGQPGKAFNTSQLVAMGITEVEIEAELAAAAARRAPGDRSGAIGLALATAAARVLASLAAKTAELRDRTGFAPDGPFADEGLARTLTAYLGGAPMLESELARALGIRDLPAQETGG